MKRLLGLILVLPALIMGCGGGDLVPLAAPGGDCDFPFDPLWRQDQGLNGSSALLGVAWPPDTGPVVVGADGFIATHNAVAGWVHEESSVTADLNLVCGDGAGALAALGEGTLVVRPPGGSWQEVPGLEDRLWYDLAGSEGRFYLAGWQGALAEVTAGGGAVAVETRTTATLRVVLAEPDSVFVGGYGGVFQVLADGNWSRPFPDLPDTFEVHSIMRLDDGRLMVGARYFEDLNGHLYPHHPVFTREAGGWVQRHELDDFWPSRLRYEDGYLWQTYGNLNRWDVSNDPWTMMVSAPGWSALGDFGFGPEGRVLQVHDRGELIWWEPGGDDAYKPVVDPAGKFFADHLLRLNDGTVVAPGYRLLAEIRSTGPRIVTGLGPAVQALLTPDALLAGPSLDDFTLFVGSSLYHCRAGQDPMARELPPDLDPVQKLLVTDDGRVLLKTTHQAYFHDGQGWQQWDAFPIVGDIQLTRQQTPVVLSGFEVGVAGPTGLEVLNLGSRCLGVAELAPGELTFFTEGFDRILYFLESGRRYDWTEDPAPGCSELRARGFLEIDGGALFYTPEHSLVLVARVSGRYAEWDLVAGPWMSEIEDLQMLPDGGLAALDSSWKTLLLHAAPGL